MSKITIVSGADGSKEYRNMLKFCIKSTSRFGYNSRIYDLGGLGMGIPYKTPPGKCNICMAKPKMILDSLVNVDGPILWMDADTFMLQSVDELIDPSYDLAIFYFIRKIRRCMTAGVMYFNNTTGSKSFLEAWNRRIEDRKLEDYSEMEPSKLEVKPSQLGDQIFLNNMIQERHGGGKTQYVDNIKEIEGAKVVFLDANIYNEQRSVSMGREPPEEVKIIHFPGHRDREEPHPYHKYLRKYGIFKDKTGRIGMI